LGQRLMANSKDLTDSLLSLSGSSLHAREQVPGCGCEGGGVALGTFHDGVGSYCCGPHVYSRVLPENCRAANLLWCMQVLNGMT